MKHWHFIAENEIALNLHQFYYDEIVGLGGWSSKNVIEEKDKVYIEINLIETVNDTDEYNTLTNREKIIIEKSEKFISKEKIKEQNLEFQSDDLDKSHLLIITFNGDPNVDYSKIEQALANSKLEYKLEADVSSTAEVGASGGWRRFLIALVGDIRSAAISELVSGVLKSSDIIYDRITMVDTYDIGRIKSEIAKNISIYEEQLTLVDYRYEKNEKEHHAIFKTRDGYIYGCCDSRFKLLNLKKSRDLEGLSKMYL